MPDLSEALAQIAAGRRRDPLAPVTVIVPSHVAGLQARRRLAALGPYAGVRFETLPRLAELIGAGALAAAGRAPLARPIGDYVAQEVARESRGAFAGVADLPGYARVLRRIFRRLRRGGLRTSDDGRSPSSGSFAEILRLYGRFRQATARFYDEEDLFEAAAEVLRLAPGPHPALSQRERALGEGTLGETFVVPPGAQSAGAAALLAALRSRVVAYTELDDPLAAAAETRFVLAPDPASEAREAVREVIRALDAGVPLHEVAVFHGADASYRALLREAFAAAGIPAAILPGTPLSEMPAGRGVMALARLPERDFSRTAVLDLLRVAPLRRALPGPEGPVAALHTAWDRVSRAAGVTHGVERWSSALAALADDRREALAPDLPGEDEGRRRALQFEMEQAGRLDAVIQHLSQRLEPLRQPEPAHAFIAAFRALVDDYFDAAAAALPEVVQEIEQLGTVGAVGGSFSLATFVRALEANLQAAAVRERRLGDGVLVADYRTAAGLAFRQVVLCGAYEGALPAGPGPDPLVEDHAWSALRADHPYIEDAALRLQRAQAAARRAVATAGAGLVVWSAPLHEATGTHEYYPSPLMVEAATGKEATLRTASALRRHRTDPLWLRRGASALGQMLAGPIIDAWELHLRRAVALQTSGRPVPPDHRLWPAVRMLRARRDARFSEWDGNLSALAGSGRLGLTRSVSPTSLEDYGACGFRYLHRHLLRLNAVEEPEERETMDPAARGSLLHQVLNDFFQEQRRRGRPVPHEPWTAADRDLLLELAEGEMKEARRRGLAGLDLFAAHELRAIRADLREFLRQDSAFRRETGAVPSDFEARIAETSIAGVTLRGIVDRIDRSPDGREAWVIDYKTGSKKPYEGIRDQDPFAGGTRLQLPIYAEGTPGPERVTAGYWFVSRAGGFEWVNYVSTPERQERLRDVLATMVEGIRGGAFPAVSGDENAYYGGWENCRYCDFTRLCSRRRDDEFAEKREDPAVLPWLRVGLVAKGEAGEP